MRLRLIAFVFGLLGFGVEAADLNITNVTRAVEVPSGSYALGTTGLVTRLLPINLMSVDHATTADSATTATNVFPSSSWSFIHIPDWQTTTSNNLQIAANTIISNSVGWNLKFALFTGDIQADGSTIAQWRSATNYIYQLAAAGIRCLLVPGNHDADYDGTVSLTNWNTFFGSNFYVSQSWWSGGFMDAAETGSGVYSTYTNSPTDKWLFVGVGFNTDLTNCMWVSNTVALHPDHRTVYFTHWFLDKDGQLSTTASGGYGSGFVKASWAWATNLSFLPNLNMVLGGNDIDNSGVSISSGMTAEARDGHTVQMAFLNNQGGAATLDTIARLYTVDPNRSTVKATALACYYGTNYVDGQLNTSFSVDGNAHPISAEYEIAVNSTTQERAPYGAHLALRQMSNNQLTTNQWTLGYNGTNDALEVRHGTSPSVISNPVVVKVTSSGGIEALNFNTPTNTPTDGYAVIATGTGGATKYAGTHSYTILMSCQASTLTTNTTYSYFGIYPAIATTSSETSREVVIPYSGTLKAAGVNIFSGTYAGAASYIWNVRINNTTDVPITSIVIPTSTVATNGVYVMNQALTAGDRVTIKVVGPVYDPATPPQVYPSVTLYIEQ